MSEREGANAPSNGVQNLKREITTMSDEKRTSNPPPANANQSGPAAEPQAFGAKPGQPLPRKMPTPPKEAVPPIETAPAPEPLIKHPASNDPVPVVQFGTALPSMTFTLPSMGLLYPNEIPNGDVKLRALGLREQMILNTPALHVKDEAFPMIFRSCVTGLPQNMDVLDLFAEDKNAIFIALRQLSYGQTYKVTVTCPRRACNREYDHMVDLEKDLKVTYLERDNAPKYPLTIPAEHLMCKRAVRVRLQTWRDEINLSRERDRALDEANALIDPTLRIRLGQQIVDIQDVPAQHMAPFLETLSAHDVSIIEQIIIRDIFGVDTTIQPSECPKCGHKFKAVLTISEGFFRATLPETEAS